MPRFHFNVVGGPAHIDDQGTELPSASVARRYLVDYASALLKENATDFGAESWRFELADESGLIVFALRIEPWLAPARNKLY